MRPQDSFLQQPIRSLQTMLQIIALDDERIPQVIPDGIYGQHTISAVNRFQQLYGLPITGITDQATWEKITEVYDSALIRVDKAEPIEIIMDRGYVMVPGSNSPYVYFLQSMLLNLSTDHSSVMKPNITGDYDTQTEESVRSFQKINGLPVTGQVDKITWKNIVHQFSLNVHHNMRNEN